MGCIILPSFTAPKGHKSATLRPGKGNSTISFPENYVVFDLETTGFSPMNDDIIEISCVRVRERVVTDTFSSLVRPKKEISECVADLTGITNEMVADAPSLKEIMPSAVEFIGDDIIVGHNVAFDINFIYDASAAALNHILSNDYIDTVRISRRLYPELHSHRLHNVVEHLGIQPVGFHRALNDCYMTYECFEAMHKEVSSKYPNLKKFISTKPYSGTHSHGRTHNDSYAQSIIRAAADKPNTNHPLYGKVCVFTGELKKMSRQSAMNLVTYFGGQCGKNVTRKTNYLILGSDGYCFQIKDSKSSKQKKAEEYKLKGYDIEIIPENVFYDMIEE